MKNKNNIINKIKKIMEKNSGSKKIIAVALLILAVAVFGFWLKSKADQPATSLTVTNTAPDTPSSVYEYVASDYHAGNTNKVSNGTYPTNVGTEITFKATASDGNGDHWKLAICKNATVPTVDSGTPSCSSSGNQICVSTAFADSGSENTTCKYTPVAGDDESIGWYAYACDDTDCSTAVDNQGTKSDGSQSPFNVNHRPSFTVATAPTADPGGTFTFTTTASESDTHDKAELYVCKSSGFTSDSDSPGCTGDTWCSDTMTGTDPQCNMSGVPIQDTTYDAYAYIVDSYGFAAAATNPQGQKKSATVNNVAPEITSDSIDLLNTSGADEDLVLTEPIGTAGGSGLTPGFSITFTATDANGCQNSSAGQELTQATAVIYRSGVSGGKDCSMDLNNCYADFGDCSQDSGGSNCSGASDTSATWTCTFPLGIISDPTDTGSVYDGHTWIPAVKIKDDNSVWSSSNAYTVTTGTGAPKILDQAMFYAVDEAVSGIVYGSVAPNGTSSKQTTTLRDEGNTGIQSNVSGTDMTGTPSGTIDVSQQHYSLNTGFGWGDPLLVYPLPINTGTPDTVADYCVKPTEVVPGASPPSTLTFTSTTHPTYWKVQVPSGKPAGSYTGTNTIEGIVSASGNW